MISFATAATLLFVAFGVDNPLWAIAAGLFAISGNICMAKDELSSFNLHLTDKLKDIILFFKRG